MTLTVRRCAGINNGSTIWQDIYFRVFLHWVDATGDFDIDADADTELNFVTTFATLGLFGASL